MRVGAEIPTIKALLRQAGATLKEVAGEEAALWEARQLLEAASGQGRSWLLAHGDEPLPADLCEKFLALLARRLRHEPIAYLTGSWDFWDFTVKVSKATLIPRPDSETVIEAVKEKRPASDKPFSILDLGTGTGILLFALLREFPQALGIGTDKSPDAALLAAENAASLGLSGRSSFVAASWFEAFRPQKKFDVIVSNPPYIAEAVIPTLAPGVRDYEPLSALSGGPDGLSAYLEIFAKARSYLTEGGVLAAETGFDQGEAVCRLAVAYGWQAEIKKDRAGRDRVVILT